MSLQVPWIAIDLILNFHLERDFEMLFPGSAEGDKNFALRFCNC